MAVERIKVTECKTTEQPRPRLDVYGYTLAGGSPTNMMVRLEGMGNRWYRVYCLCFSNASSLIVKPGKRTVFVDIPDCVQ